MPPALRVRGAAALEIREYPDPIIVHKLMVSGEVPEDVRVNVSAFELPTETLPKSSVDKLAETRG